MLVNINVPDANIIRALVSARYEMRNYARLEYEGPMHFFVSETDGGDDNATHQVTAADLQRGIVLMAERYPEAFAALMMPLNIDGAVGALLVQLAIFGEEKYA